MRTIYTFLFVCFIFSTGFSQGFNLYEPLKQNPDAGIAGLQLAFDEWVKDKDLSITKINKPLQRWLWFSQARMQADDNIPVLSNYLKAYKEINAQKDNKSFKNSWVPKGPFDLVNAPNSILINNIGRLNCIAFHPSDPDIFWVGAPQGGIWKTVDGGQSWIPLGDDLPIMRISDIAVDPVDPDILYICIGDYGYLGFYIYNLGYYPGRVTYFGLGVYKSTDGGMSWTPTGLTFNQEDGVESLMRRVFINPENTSELLAAGVTGIYKSSDQGVSWGQVSDKFIWDIEKQQGNYRVMYASTFEGDNDVSGIMRSTDFGENWQWLNTGIPSNNAVVRIEVAVAPSDTNYVYAACAGHDDSFYAFFQSTDAGNTWSMKADSSQINIFGQFDGDPSNKLAQSSYDLWVMVDPVDPERVFCGAMSIWGSENGGADWSICSLGLNVFGESIHYDHHYVAQNPLDGKYYMCCDGGLYRTDSLIIENQVVFDSCWDNNYLNTNCFEFHTEWENLSGGLVITEFYRLGLSENNSGWVIAGSQDNCTFYKNDSEEWINLTNGDGMECMIHPDNTDIIYASNQFGYLFKSLNGGQNMSNILTYGIVQQEGTGVWITPFQMDQQAPSTIYGGFKNLWRSDQGGSGWYKISNFANMPGYGYPKPIWDFELAPGNPDIIFVSKQPFPLAGYQFSGEMWKTTDGGQNWTNITNALPVFYNYINDIAITENPDVVYISLMGFQDGKKVYRTINGGQAWENITGALPNIPVTSIVYQVGSSKHDAYIGTDLGVYHLNDDYTDWHLFSDNLPNVVINELQIDYKEDKLYAATYGRGIWMVDLINPLTGFGSQAAAFENSELQLSPNPANDNIKIDVRTSFRGVAQLQIVDVTGAIVFREGINIGSESHHQVLDISKLHSGVYFVRISFENRSKVARLVKK